MDVIDIHNNDVKLERELQTFACDTRLTQENRTAILQFIEDCRIGRVVHKHAKKRLSTARCRKMLTTLRRFGMEVSGSFKDITVAEMERIVLGLEEGRVRKLTNLHGSYKYNMATVLDFKKILKKFYTWMFPDDIAHVEQLTAWFDTREYVPELHTFGLDEAQRMARALGDPQSVALIMMLFDGGFRAGELFNVRLRDIRFQPDLNGVDTCFVKIRVSKTKPRMISLPLATEDVRFWIERHPSSGPLGPDGHIQAKDPDAPLITWSYQYCRKLLATVGKQELGERVYFHRFRHASATYYAKRIGHYQLTARYGWTMGSRAIQRYIDHSGVLAEDVATSVREQLSPREKHDQRVSMTVQELLETIRAMKE